MVEATRTWDNSENIGPLVGHPVRYSAFIPNPRPKLLQSYPPPLSMCRHQHIPPVSATEIITRRAAIAYVDAIGRLPLKYVFG